MRMARQIQLQIDDLRCQVCDPCQAAAVCKVHAILRIDPDEPPLLDIERCYDCRLCLPACPFGAVIHLNGERR